MTKSTGTILDDFNDSVKPFSDSISQPADDIGQDAVAMFTDHFDEIAHRLKSGSQRGCRPTFQETRSCPGCFVVPEVLEFIFKHPSAVDTPIAFAEGS